MAEYIRMVSYLNMYKNGEKKQNCGFAKIDSRNGICRVYVNIQMPFIRERFDCKVHFFLRDGDVLYGISIGTVTVENGRGFAGISMVSSNIGNMGYGISEMSGIYITTDEVGMIIASEWDDIPIQTYNFKDISEKRENIEQTTYKQADIQTENIMEQQPEDTVYIQASKQANMQVDKQEGDESDTSMGTVSGQVYESEEVHMETESVDSDENNHREFWNSLGKRCVRMKVVDGFEECMRMKPCDIVCLPKKYWALGQNSFLLHGYYNYRYLIAARYIEDGVEKYVVGVPGVYHGNEKIMASMFGFGTFTGKEDDGEKGFWCMNLE